MVSDKDISVFETTAVIKLCKFTVFSSGSFCQIYRVTDEALIAETMVWPNFFFMLFFFALKGFKLFYYYFLSLQQDVVPCGGRKKSPRTHL